MDKGIRTLARISSIINSSLDITEILGNSMSLVEELMSAEACSIFELDNEKNELFFRVSRCDPEDRAKDIRIKTGEGIVGYVASTGETLVVPDTGKDSRFHSKVDALTGFKTDSIIAVPIKNKGRIVGVLQALNSKKIESLDDKELEILSVVANQVGIALENARLYGRLQEKFTLTRDELKAAQAQLIRSERLAALGELCKGIAHEVRNPVMSIGGLAKRLKKTLPAGNHAAQYTDIILQETARLEKMVHDVEHYTALPDPDLRQVKLSELLNSTIDIWKTEHEPIDIEVTMESMTEDPVILVDRNLMRTALVNVLVNAQESIMAKGKVIIGTWWDEKLLVISIKDSGAGITREDLPRVFDPFFTSKTQGAGLGLTTVNHIVSGHGGEVKIYSAPQVGTDVHIRFPALITDGPL